MVSIDLPPDNYTIGEEGELCCHGAKKGGYDAETLCRGADHRDVKGRLGWRERPGPVPEARDLGSPIEFIKNHHEKSQTAQELTLSALV